MLLVKFSWLPPSSRSVRVVATVEMNYTVNYHYISTLIDKLRPRKFDEYFGVLFRRKNKIIPKIILTTLESLSFIRDIY